MYPRVPSKREWGSTGCSVGRATSDGSFRIVRASRWIARAEARSSIAERLGIGLRSRLARLQVFGHAGEDLVNLLRRCIGRDIDLNVEAEFREGGIGVFGVTTSAVLGPRRRCLA